MRTVWWLVILLVLLGGGLLLWAREAKTMETSVRNYPSQGTDVIAFGDSLVAGVGATPGHDLASDLSAAVGVPVVNLGRSGDTTAEALSRVEELGRYSPKVVVIVLGGNDYLQHQPMDQAFKNLGQIIAAAQARGAAVLVVGIRMSPTIGNFDAEFAQLVATYHTAYVANALDGIFGNPALMSDDIHPNDQGYALMASRIAPALQKLLQ